MESGLIFNQLICEFESRRRLPSFGRMLNVTTTFQVSRSITCRPSYVGRSSTVEHRTVTAAREGSSPFDPPKIFARNCGRGVRHLIVDQADDGSSPFSSAMRQ